MNIKPIFFLFFIILLLFGCDDQAPTESCSSPDTKKLMSQLITEQAEKLSIKKKFDAYGGAFELGVSQIHEALAQVQIAIENTRLAKQSHKSSKELCSGLLQLTVPTYLLTHVDRKRNLEHEAEISQYAKQFNIQNSNNVFTQDVEYKVQSNDGNAQYVEFRSDGWVHLLDKIITTSLFNSTPNIIDADPHNEQKRENNENLKPRVETKKNEVKPIKLTQDKNVPEKLSKDVQPITPKHHEQVALATGVNVKRISPGFDCTKATMPVDIKICSSAKLAALDVENMMLYKKAKLLDEKAAKSTLSESIKLKFSCGTNANCIEKSYKKSIKNYKCIAAGNKLSICRGEFIRPF